MTNNQLTDKRLAQLAKRNFCQTRGEVYVPFGDEIVSMAEELQERRKADSEPVAYRWNYGGTTIWRLLDTKPGPGSNSRYPRVIEPLYRHAQSSPVVLDEVTAEYCPALVKYDVTEVDEAWARGFNACRAAMLNGGKS